MAVSRNYAEETGLPVNGAVKCLPRRKLFRFFFNGATAPSSDFPLESAARQMTALGLTPKGSCYITVFMSANIKNSVQRCGVISIPIS